MAWCSPGLQRWPRLLLKVVLLSAVAVRPHAEEPAAPVAATAAEATARAAGAKWGSEQSLLNALKAQRLADIETLPLLQFCISKSWFAAVRELVVLTHSAGAELEAAGGGSGAGILPIKDEVSRLLLEVKSNADAFAATAEAAYRGQTDGLVEVPCAVQWAQNSTTVFVGVKYAARWSAPGAIEVTDVAVNVTSSSFHLNGYGHHSSIRKRYLVDLDLYGAVLPTPISHWSVGSVGRMTAILHKEKPGRWPRILKSKEKGRHPITKWLDMEERWSAELEETEKTEPQKEKEKRDKADKEKKAEKAKEKEKAKPPLKKSEKAQSWKKYSKTMYRRLPLLARNALGSGPYGPAGVNVAAGLALVTLVVVLLLQQIFFMTESEAPARPKVSSDVAAAAADAATQRATQPSEPASTDAEMKPSEAAALTT